MAQLPMTAEDGQALVDAGHMTPETHAEALAANAFAPTSAPVGTAPVDNGDIHPLDAITGGLASGGSQQAFNQDLASLPTSPDQPPAIPGGVQVASNDPAIDQKIAAGLISPNASTQPDASVEAGHIPPSALALPAGQSPAAPPSALEKLADPAAIAQGMKSEQQGLSSEYSAGKKQADETAGFLKTMREHAEAQQAQEAQMEQQRQDAASAQYQKVQQAADAASQASKIDPNHFWASRSTGQKVAAAIGIALGGLGGGLTGHGGNAAMDVINKAIDRDIDAQKFNASQKQTTLQNQMGVYGMMRQKFGDERQAEAATRMAYLQSAELQLKETASRYQAPEMQARFQMLSGQLQQKQAELARGVLASGYQMAAMRQLTGGGQVGAAALSALPKDVQERVVPLNGGATHGVAYSADAAKEVRGVSSAADSVRSIIGEMRQLKDEGGKRVLPYGTLQAKAQALQSRLVPALNEMAGLKRLSDADIKIMKDQIPDPGSWLGDKSSALLDGLDQSVQDRTESYYKNNLMGYRPTKFTRTR